MGAGALAALPDVARVMIERGVRRAGKARAEAVLAGR